MVKHKVAFLISHPTQYHSPLFRELAKQPEIDLTVYFCSKIGLGEQYDKTYERVLKWDTPLLEGYKSIFLKKFLGPLHPQIFGELKKNKYDALIVHGYNSLTYWLAFFAAWFTKTPLILKGEADLSKKISYFKRVIKKIILKSLFKRANAFLYSYDLNKEFFEFYGAPDEKLFFCPSTVDNNFWQTKREELRGKKDKIKTELGINKDLPTVLFVGQFIKRKRVMDLLEAADNLKKENTNFNLLIVGDGPEKENLTSFIEGRNMKDTLIIGFKNQSELPRLYASSDIFVLPSESDPSPKAMQEAMNFGLSVIATNRVGTASVLVEKSGSGYIYPVGDKKELANKLEILVSNNPLREEKSKKAEEAIKNWSLEEDIKGIIKAIEYVKQSSKRNH